MKINFSHINFLKRNNGNFQISSSQTILLGFLGVILLGTFLLMLPFSSVEPGGTPFLDALFTATSATCVTGLVVHDTATYWSQFGQTVIIILIQIGGMGVITVAVSIAVFSGHKLSLMQRSTMQEAISAPELGGVMSLTGFVLRVIAAVELAGAVLLFPWFAKEVGILKGIWYALFHSISAFCNAGFDLMGIKSPYSSLTYFSGSPGVNIIIMALIIIGGIGFLTWNDIRVHGFHFKRYRLQTKVVLVITLVLILLPTAYFYFVEFSGKAWENMPTGERVLASLFQAITPRTAGFNTVDYMELTESGRTITIILMLLGGSPGSTAGGMKITTLAVLAASAISIYRRTPDARMFGRRISEDAVRQAGSILLLYLTLFLTGGLLIAGMEGISVHLALFETASAIGTVGLGTGLTPGLASISKLILIALMFLGRIGGLTFIFAALSGKKNAAVSKYPEERIMVG